MVEVVAVMRGVLALMRMAVFGLSLGITVISFQAYRQRPSERLQYAFMGFAFISMGVASTVIAQIGARNATEAVRLFFRITEAIPFIIGFAMLYVSLYRD
ncbi:DUF7521 family protein [Halosimplex marinum]|uniref:DUF7521 family protein n=1 Tax=Halosimplex marinum TaxID=3396620 RepID=UPI003F57FF6E